MKLHVFHMFHTSHTFLHVWVDGQAVVANRTLVAPPPCVASLLQWRRVRVRLLVRVCLLMRVFLLMRVCLLMRVFLLMRVRLQVRCSVRELLDKGEAWHVKVKEALAEHKQ